jgi:hypothetical protein
MFGKSKRTKNAPAAGNAEPPRRPLATRPRQDPAYRPAADDDATDRDYLWEEGDPADRRRDPLRRR